MTPLSHHQPIIATIFLTYRIFTRTALTENVIWSVRQKLCLGSRRLLMSQCINSLRLHWWIFKRTDLQQYWSWDSLDILLKWKKKNFIYAITLKKPIWLSNSITSYGFSLLRGGSRTKWCGYLLSLRHLFFVLWNYWDMRGMLYLKQEILAHAIFRMIGWCRKAAF